MKQLLFFYRKQCTYNPQKTHGHTPTQKATKSTNGNLLYQTKERPTYEGGSTDRFPSNILYYDVVDNAQGCNLSILM